MVRRYLRILPAVLVLGCITLEIDKADGVREVRTFGASKTTVTTVTEGGKTTVTTETESAGVSDGLVAIVSTAFGAVRDLVLVLFNRLPPPPASAPQ